MAKHCKNWSQTAKVWIKKHRREMGIVAVIVLLIGTLCACGASLAKSNSSNDPNGSTVSTGTAEDTNGTDETEVTDETAPTTQEAEASQDKKGDRGAYQKYQELVDSHPDLVFHNFELLSDGDQDNNSHFGPNRYHADWAAKDYYEDFKEIIKQDPLILVAAIATVDAVRDTDLVGDYYNGNDKDWAKTMNVMVEDLISGKVNIARMYEVFSEFLDNEVRDIKLVHMDDINDQMYITPYTYSGVPKLVVSETHESGDILVITVKKKGGSENDKTVGFRAQCGYQPVNVADRLGIKPTPVPEIPEHTPEHTPEPGKGGNTPQPEPEPQPQPEPEYVKDVTQGQASDPGEGRSPYTNNGDGAQTSSAAVEEQPTSYEEYEERVEETESQVGDSSSTTPSTEAPEDTTVFNDGAEAANDPATDPSFDRPADGSELNADPDAEWSIQE